MPTWKERLRKGEVIRHMDVSFFPSHSVHYGRVVSAKERVVERKIENCWVNFQAWEEYLEASSRKSENFAKGTKILLCCAGLDDSNPQVEMIHRMHMKPAYVNLMTGRVVFSAPASPSVYVPDDFIEIVLPIEGIKLIQQDELTQVQTVLFDGSLNEATRNAQMITLLTESSFRTPGTTRPFVAQHRI